jgi:uncharacterized membrane protein
VLTESGRLEAFSDGVLAIAITLLVLDLRPPQLRPGESLARGLADQWESYAAYVVSFLVIGVIWLNHNTLFSLIRYVDRWVLVSNLVLLMVVAAIPFPTQVLAKYLTAGDADSRTAALLYTATMLAMAVAFTLLFAAVSRRQDLMRPGVDAARVRAGLPRFGAGVVIYAATMLVALVSAPICLLVHFGIAAYYVFDQVGARLAKAAGGGV